MHVNTSTQRHKHIVFMRIAMVSSPESRPKATALFIKTTHTPTHTHADHTVTHTLMHTHTDTHAHCDTHTHPRTYINSAPHLFTHPTQYALFTLTSVYLTVFQRGLNRFRASCEFTSSLFCSSTHNRPGVRGQDVMVQRPGDSIWWTIRCGLRLHFPTALGIIHLELTRPPAVGLEPISAPLAAGPFTPMGGEPTIPQLSSNTFSWGGLLHYEDSVMPEKLLQHR